MYKIQILVHAWSVEYTKFCLKLNMALISIYYFSACVDGVQVQLQNYSAFEEPFAAFCLFDIDNNNLMFSDDNCLK